MTPWCVVIGLAIAYAALHERTPRWVRSALTTFSGVAANFGGIPLAFAFIATLGSIGIVRCRPFPPDVLRNVGRPSESSVFFRIRAASITLFHGRSGPGSRSKVS